MFCLLVSINTTEGLIYVKGSGRHLEVAAWLLAAPARDTCISVASRRINTLIGPAAPLTRERLCLCVNTTKLHRRYASHAVKWTSENKMKENTCI